VIANAQALPAWALDASDQRYGCACSQCIAAWSAFLDASLARWEFDNSMAKQLSGLHTLMVTAAAGLCFLQNVPVPVDDYHNRRCVPRASDASYAVTQVKWSIHLREVQPLQCCLYVRVILHKCAGMI
jgi:hypothetical protein